MKRKMIFYCGLINSGKIYYVLKVFMAVKFGVYCGLLRLLVVEVFNKCLENVSMIKLFISVYICSKLGSLIREM